jgi:hypothetical protein
MSLVDLQLLASIVSTIQGIFFIISVFFIWYQIRQSNRLSRAAYTQSLVEMAAPFLLQLSQDRQLAELWVNGTKNYETMDEVERFRYQQLLFWWLIHHENIYYQYHNGLVDERLYQGWKIELHEFIRAKRIGVFWEKDMKRFFRTEFQQAVETMIVKEEPELGKPDHGDDSLPIVI